VGRRRRRRRRRRDAQRAGVRAGDGGDAFEAKVDTPRFPISVLEHTKVPPTKDDKVTKRKNERAPRNDLRGGTIKVKLPVRVSW